MNKFAAIAIVISSIFSAGAANLGSTKMLHQPVNAVAEPAPFVVAVDTTELQEEIVRIDPTEAAARELTEYASRFLGRKYVWGATGPKSFDCSGFTGYVFRHGGIDLPRTSRMQYNQGTKVAREDLRAGDLMFFSSPRSGRGKVGHVGIVVDVDESTGSVTFIHASTKKGITYQKFPDGGYYSRAYIGAKRVIS